MSARPGPPPSTGFFFPGPQHLHKDLYPSIDASANPSLAQPGKVVLITGAGRGIGRGIAIQYAHAHVRSIYLVARSSAQLEEVAQRVAEIDAEIRVHTHAFDVTDEAAVKACAEAVAREEGRLDVLINNAGASSPWISITDSSTETWWNAFTINVKGPYLFLHAFLSLLVQTAEKNGTTVDVVNMASIGANSTSPGASSYQTSKSAVSRLTEYVQLEYGAKGVNAVAVHPGGVPTEMTDAIDYLRPFMTDSQNLCGGFLVWLTKGGRTWLGGRYASATWDVDRLEEMKEEIVQGDKLKLRLVI